MLPLIVPAPDAGFTLHVTPVLLVPVTVAENGTTCPAVTVIGPGGVTVIVTGCSVTVAVPTAPPTLVAVTVTVCVAVTELGAVYTPAPEICPVPAGLIVHVTV